MRLSGLRRLVTEPIDEGLDPIAFLALAFVKGDLARLAFAPRSLEAVVVAGVIAELAGVEMQDTVGDRFRRSRS